MPRPPAHTTDDPFSVLGLAPTSDPAAIKRAYFAALHRHPPHTDPTAFRRVREAYEQLASAGRRFTALVTSPPDLDALLGPEESATAAALVSLAAQRRANDEAAVTAGRAVDALARMTLVDAMTVFSD